VLPGDCLQVAPVGVADRVLLGLLPSSEDSWPTAVAALKATGGCGGGGITDGGLKTAGLPLLLP
jgi:tRNA G37 N-methylase Trm5